MAAQVIRGIFDMVKLYVHSVYKLCGTTVTAPASFLARAFGESESTAASGVHIDNHHTSERPSRDSKKSPEDWVLPYNVELVLSCPPWLLVCFTEQVQKG